MARVCVRDWQVDQTSKAQRQDACRSLAVVYRLSAICRPVRTPGYVASSSTFAALVASARRCRSERNKGARTQQGSKKSLFLHVPALFNTQPNCTSVNASKAHKGLANRPFGRCWGRMAMSSFDIAELQSESAKDSTARLSDAGS